jgi:hypothetical protein
MTPEQALQTLAGIINQAEFKGSIAIINQMGQQAQKALEVLAEAIKPKEEVKKK